MRDIGDEEATQPQTQREKVVRRPPHRPQGDDIAEEFHSESCITREISHNQVLPRASTEPQHTSPIDPSPNGKQSTGTSDTLFQGSDDSHDARATTDGKPQYAKRRFPWLHKGKEINSQSGEPLTKTPSKKKKFPKKIPVKQQLRGIFWTWPNILLICVSTTSHPGHLTWLSNSSTRIRTIADSRTGPNRYRAGVCPCQSIGYLPCQLPGNHTTCRHPVLRDRGDRTARRRDARRSTQRVVWKCYRIDCFRHCVGQRPGEPQEPLSRITSQPD